jgi:hypothetical protein
MPVYTILDDFVLYLQIIASKNLKYMLLSCIFHSLSHLNKNTVSCIVSGELSSDPSSYPANKAWWKFR